MEWKITPAEVGEMMEEISDTIVSTVPGRITDECSTHF